jgi:hypothetical protein
MKLIEGTKPDRHIIVDRKYAGYGRMPDTYKVPEDTWSKKDKVLAAALFFGSIAALFGCNHVEHVQSIAAPRPSPVSSVQVKARQPVQIKEPVVMSIAQIPGLPQMASIGSTHYDNIGKPTTVGFAGMQSWLLSPNGTEAILGDVRPVVIYLQSVAGKYLPAPNCLKVLVEVGRGLSGPGFGRLRCIYSSPDKTQQVWAENVDPSLWVQAPFAHSLPRKFVAYNGRERFKIGPIPFDVVVMDAEHNIALAHIQKSQYVIDPSH